MDAAHPKEEEYSIYSVDKGDERCHDIEVLFADSAGVKI